MSFEEVFEKEINDLVNQIRHPKTEKPEKEVPAVVADLMVAVERLRKFEHKRGDWLPC